MKCRIRFIAGVFGLCVLCVFNATARAQFEQLVTKVPATANAIALLNMEKVMSSPAAVKGRWKEEHNASYRAGLTFLPPESTAAVLSAYIDVEQMRPLWSVAAITLEREASLPTIERLTGAKAEPIATLPAVALEGNGYLVQFGPRLLAAISPANRQAAGRWVREVSDAEILLSPYLKEAFGYADEIGTPIVLALDLQDVTTISEVKQALAASETYGKLDPAQLDRLASVLASVRGITLGITFESEQPYGKVKVDFGQPVSMAPEAAKSLLLYALAEHGVMLDDLQDWTAKSGERAISLEGYLSPSGMRRITSLFDRPPAFKHGTEFVTATPPPATQQTSQQSSSQASVQASQEYLRRVTDLIDDLRTRPRGSANYTMGSVAKWYETFARKIDQLPAVGVDPELSNYGAFAADSLRAASSAIHSSYARKRARQTATTVPYDYYTYGTTYGYSYSWNPFGAGYMPLGFMGTFAVPDYRSYQQQRTAIGAQERVTGANQAREIISKLDEATGDIRRKMSAKHSAPF